MLPHIPTPRPEWYHGTITLECPYGPICYLCNVKGQPTKLRLLTGEIDLVGWHKVKCSLADGQICDRDTIPEISQITDICTECWEAFPQLQAYDLMLGAFPVRGY